MHVRLLRGVARPLDCRYKAKEAFLRIQGKEIHPELKHMLSKQASCKHEEADMVQDIAEELLPEAGGSTRAAPTLHSSEPAPAEAVPTGLL